MIHWTLVLFPAQDLQGQPPQTGLDAQEGIYGGDQKLNRQVSSRGWVHCFKTNHCKLHFSRYRQGGQAASRASVTRSNPACLDQYSSWLANGSDRVVRALNRAQGPLPTSQNLPATDRAPNPAGDLAHKPTRLVTQPLSSTPLSSEVDIYPGAATWLEQPPTRGVSPIRPWSYACRSGTSGLPGS